MRHVTANVNNVRLIAACGQSLMRRNPRAPGIGVLWGPTGYGKSTAAAWLASEIHAAYVRALATWTPYTMLADILRELDSSPLRTCAEMVRHIADLLAAQNKPLIIDEADYLVMRARLVETLRDLHDLSHKPLLLIGMADFRRRIVQREQLAGRVAHWVKFEAASADDVRILAKECCEVAVEEDLLEELRRQSRGEIRVLVNGLGKIEDLAKRDRLKSVSLEDWGDQPFDIRRAD